MSFLQVDPQILAATGARLRDAVAVTTEVRGAICSSSSTTASSRSWRRSMDNTVTRTGAALADR